MNFGKRRIESAIIILVLVFALFLFFIISAYINSYKNNGEKIALQSAVFDSMFYLSKFQRETTHLSEKDLFQNDFTHWYAEKENYERSIGALLENPFLRKYSEKESQRKQLYAFKEIHREILRYIDILSAHFLDYSIANYDSENGRLEDFEEAYHSYAARDLNELNELLDVSMREQLYAIHATLMDQQFSGILRLSLIPVLFTCLFFPALIILAVRKISENRRKENDMFANMAQTLDVTLDTLVYQVELRDNHTGYHIERTSAYVMIMAEALRDIPEFSEYITDQYIGDIGRASKLHDVGKIAIPDRILFKAGSLDKDEFEEIKKHCYYGELTIQRAIERLPYETFLDMALALVKSHHENWDGTGYPLGIAREDIPLCGRIMAIADVYDAMRSTRVYKESLPHSYCVNYIVNQSGKKFEPLLVNVFQQCERQFEEISENEK